MHRLIVVATLCYWGSTHSRKIHHSRQTTGVKSYDNATTEQLERLPSAQEHQVIDLPGLGTFDSKHFAGHLPTSQDLNGGQLFYWLFEAQESPETKPLVIWLNGGPGCSSLEGLFQEIGPFKVAPGGDKLDLNPYSWHKEANVMFLDQPVGTGLSFPGTSYTNSQSDVSRDFTAFFQHFMQVHANYVDRPVYFAGESYAGRYIPSIVAHLINHASFHVNIQGIAIGNGWTDPPSQYNYVAFASATGLIDEQQGNKLRQQYSACLAVLKRGDTSGTACESILDMILNQASVPGGAQLNTYDIREYLNDPSAWPAGIEAIPTYLDRVDVRRAIHATRAPHRWTECSTPVYNHLVHEDGMSSLPHVAEILKNGSVRVLFYNGQFDLICNHLGTETFLHQHLNWDQMESFRKAKRYVWVNSGSPAGYARATLDRLLTYVVFLGGSHMAPMDEPEKALDLIHRFLQDKSFQDVQQDYEISISNTTASNPTSPLLLYLISGCVLVALLMIRRRRSVGYVRV